MAEVKKSDLIYMQNELLKDISSLDKKLSDKITKLTTLVQSHQLTIDQKFEISNEKYKSLIESIESNEEIKDIKKEFSEFKRQINQGQLINTNKILTVEKDLKSACFKYDNFLSNNIFTPGLIGNGAKYKDLKTFREFVDKKISELVIYKEKNTIDLKKYKEKTDYAIAQFKIKNEKSENIYFDFCNERINEAKKEMINKYNLLDESLNNLKIENGKYSFDLLKTTEDLQNKLNIMNTIENNIDTKLKEQAEKYQNYNNDLAKLFEPQKIEFILIKSGFTELSEFIKDVRFMRNLNNLKVKEKNQNNEFNSTSFLRDSRMLSKKMNFDKPQKLSRNDEIKYSIITDFENDKENSLIKNDNYIINNKEKEINKEQEPQKEKQKDKIKYNIKANIKNLNSPKETNKVSNITTENNSTTNSNQKNNMNKTFISIFKEKNKNILIDGSPQNKKSRGKIIENNEEDFTKNKSDIFFRKQNKTQENDKNKDIKLKKIKKNFTKENGYFETYNKSKEVKEFEFNNNEDYIKKEINDKVDKIYNFIDKEILQINKKIKEVNDINKHNIEKMNKKLDLFINLNNVLLLKFKNPKNLSNKQINILTNYEYNMPLLNNNFDKNKIKSDKIKMKIKDNSSILNTKELKDINDNKEINNIKEIKKTKDKLEIDVNENYQIPNSGKILKIIEPYLIKKFRSDSEEKYKK